MDSNSVTIELVNPDEFDEFGAVLEMLQQAFLYMEGRIDPPSSLNRLDLSAFEQKAVDEAMFVARSKGRIVGCVFARLDSDYIYAGKLAVRSGFRGHGVARLLMDQVESFAKSNEVARLEIETRIELVENQRLFEHLGYVKCQFNSHSGYSRPTSICYRKNI